jgi:hypothetical protein
VHESATVSSLDYILRIIFNSSGRCTEGYELVLKDYTCPYFRRQEAHGTPVSPISPEEASKVYCSILVGDYDSNICFDIAGEAAAKGVPLIGYECTGRWNQLFYLSSNCTVAAIQPGVVGRVRGHTNSDLKHCLGVGEDGGIVLTDDCMDEPDGEGLEMTETANENGDETQATKGSEVPPLADDAINGKKNIRQFQFMPSDGMYFRVYLD